MNTETMNRLQTLEFQMAVTAQQKRDSLACKVKSARKAGGSYRENARLCRKNPKKYNPLFGTPKHRKPNMQVYNPWTEGYTTYTRQPVVTSACGRGQVFRVTSEHYDFIVNGRMVTQRMTGRVEVLEHLVAVICDGKPVKQHYDLRALRVYLRQQGLTV